MTKGKTILSMILLSFITLMVVNYVHPSGINEEKIPSGTSLYVPINLIGMNTLMNPGAGEMKGGQGGMNVNQPGAPSGIMGGHSHKANELMFSYDFMYMSMKGNLMQGSNSISISQASQYMMVPTEMTMEMHMFGLMYAPIDNLVVMAMLPYYRKKMTMQHVMPMMGMPTVMSESSDGIGDLEISVGYTFLRLGNHTFHADLSFGIPTGSININGASGNRLGYDMQMGTGSVSLTPVITYMGSANTFGWGAQLKGTFQLNENSNHYTVGNLYKVSAWGAWRFISWSSVSFRLDMNIQDNISGRDPALMASDSPGADPTAYGYTRLDGLIGINFYLPKLGPLRGRISLEGGIPLYQRVDGIKTGVDWLFNAGLRIAASF